MYGIEIIKGYRAFVLKKEKEKPFDFFTGEDLKISYKFIILLIISPPFDFFKKRGFKRTR
jgi:hypothetical protein